MRILTSSLFILALFFAQAACADNGKPVPCSHTRDQFQFAHITPMTGEDGQRPEGIKMKVDPRFAIVTPSVHQEPYIDLDTNDKSVTEKLDKWASHVTVSVLDTVNGAIVDFLSPAVCYI